MVPIWFLWDGAAAAVEAPRRGGAFYPTPEELRYLQQKEQEDRAREREIEKTIQRAYNKAHGIPEAVEEELQPTEVIPEWVEPFFLDSGEVDDPPLRPVDPYLVATLARGQQTARQPTEEEIMYAEVAKEWAEFQQEAAMGEQELDERLRDDPIFKKIMMFLNF